MATTVPAGDPSLSQAAAPAQLAWQNRTARMPQFTGLGDADVAAGSLPNPGSTAPAATPTTAAPAPQQSQTQLGQITNANGTGAAPVQSGFDRWAMQNWGSLDRGLGSPSAAAQTAPAIGNAAPAIGNAAPAPASANAAPASNPFGAPSSNAGNASSSNPADSGGTYAQRMQRFSRPQGAPRQRFGHFLQPRPQPQPTAGFAAPAAGSDTNSNNAY